MLHYVVADYLNSSSAVTDSTGATEELLDYYPYGTIRLDQQVGGFLTYAEQRKYIGQEYDADTGLNYLNARYYSATNGNSLVRIPYSGKLVKRKTVKLFSVIHRL